MTPPGLSCPANPPSSPSEDGDGLTVAETCELLHQRLMGLSFHAFLGYVRCILIAMGYTNVTLMSRTAWHQRTAHGGWDLSASAMTGVTHARLIVQAKQYARPVSRRFIDEIRGATLRVGATHAMLITSGRFSRAAQRVLAPADTHAIVPVTLMDGDHLLYQALAHGVGVRTAAKHTWALDEPFFACLSECYPGRTGDRRPASPTAPTALAASPRERVLLRIAWRGWALTITHHGAGRRGGG